MEFDGSLARPPAVAGIFYPSTSKELTATVQYYLSQAKEKFSGANLMSPKAIIAPHAGTTFTLGFLPGTGEAALRNAVAGRVRTTPTYHDGSDSFFLTEGPSPTDVVVALSADGLPDGLTLTMHLLVLVCAHHNACGA